MTLNHVAEQEPAGSHSLRLLPGFEINGEVLDASLLNAFEELQEPGEADLIVELIDLYLEDAPRRIAALTKAASNSDWSEVKRAAHNLKGSSANLGVQLVSEVCAELEAFDNNLSTRDMALPAQLQLEFARAEQALLAERLRRVQ